MWSVGHVRRRFHRPKGGRGDGLAGRSMPHKSNGASRLGGLYMTCRTRPRTRRGLAAGLSAAAGLLFAAAAPSPAALVYTAVDLTPPDSYFQGVYGAIAEGAGDGLALGLVFQ